MTTYNENVVHQTIRNILKDKMNGFPATFRAICTMTADAKGSRVMDEYVVKALFHLINQGQVTVINEINGKPTKSVGYAWRTSGGHR